MRVLDSHKPKRMLPEQERHYTAARLLAVEMAPYLAVAIYRLIPISVSNLGTVAVDRWWRIYIDCSVFEAWNVYQRALAIVHEVFHLIRDHANRCESLNADERLFNIAADAEINDDLNCFEFVGVSGISFQGVPDNWILPGRLRPSAPNNETAEFYYHHLTEHCEDENTPANDSRNRESNADISSFSDPFHQHTVKICDHLDCGSGAGGSIRNWEEGLKSEYPSVDVESANLIRRQVANAILNTKMQGKVPSGVLRWAQTEVHESVIHWKRVLSGKIKRAIGYKAGQVDYSYRRMSRRKLPSVILPAMINPIPSIAIVLDTSGSMLKDDIIAAISEIVGISRQVGVRGANLKLIQVETEVCRIESISNVRNIQIVGGGGTDLRAGFSALAEVRPKPDLLVVLTDGYTPWPETWSGCRVVVGLIGSSIPTNIIDSVPSWASVIEINPFAEH